MDELIAAARDCRSTRRGRHAGRADHVYPDAAEEGDDHPARRLLLSDKDPQELTLPIDLFFRSLAQDFGRRRSRSCCRAAAATARAGSSTSSAPAAWCWSRAGQRAVRRHAAQRPSAPAWSITPPPGHAARVLARRSPLGGRRRHRAAANAGGAMDAVLRLLRDQFGIDFSLQDQHGRPPHRAPARLLASRTSMSTSSPLRSRRAQRALPGSADRRDAVLPRPDAFEVLEREVIPAARRAAPEHDRPRLGRRLRHRRGGVLAGDAVPSCLARRRPINLKIFATDVHQRIARARRHRRLRRGATSRQRQPAAPRALFSRRTERLPGDSPDLRQMIVFAPHNVIKDAPFTKIDLITCRNLLIYLQPQAQRSGAVAVPLRGRIRRRPVPRSERDAGALSDEFKTIDEHWKIYRKRRDVRTACRPAAAARRRVRRPLSIAGGRRRRRSVIARDLRPAAR